MMHLWSPLSLLGLLSFLWHDCLFGRSRKRARRRGRDRGVLS